MSACTFSRGPHLYKPVQGMYVAQVSAYSAGSVWGMVMHCIKGAPCRQCTSFLLMFPVLAHICSSTHLSGVDTPHRSAHTGCLPAGMASGSITPAPTCTRLKLILHSPMQASRYYADDEGVTLHLQQGVPVQGSAHLLKHTPDRKRQPSSLCRRCGMTQTMRA